MQHEKVMTVRCGSAIYTADVTYRVIPGEPEVRYYADGSGHPGSPAEIDCIDHVSVIDCEFPIDGDADNDDPDNWDYAYRNEFPGNFPYGIENANEAVYAELLGGAYDEELLEIEG